MIKRILSLTLVALMLVAMAAVSFSVSAAEATDAATGAGVIKFNSSKWNNVKAVYAHIWINGGDSFYPWGKTKDTQADHVQGPIYQYDLSKLNKSAEISGGLKSGVDYCIIFHADTGVQTYDLTFGLECVGDTAKVTGKMIENPVDSEKQGYEAVWTNNTSKYGPHRAITSIGSFVGSKLCPNEEGAKVIGDWIIKYPSTSQYCKPEEIVAKAMKEFKVKDIDAISGYVRQKDDIGLANVDEVDKYLAKAYKIAYGEEKKVDTTKAEEKADKIEKNDGNVEGVSDDAPTTTPSGGSNNVSGTDNDGESDTILFVLAGLMILAAGAFVATRKREE